jgi:hypothetical protein
MILSVTDHHQDALESMCALFEFSGTVQVIDRITGNIFTGLSHNVIEFFQFN